MAIVLDGTTGITTPDMTSDGGLTADGVSFASGAPANTLVTTSSGNVGIGTSSPSRKLHVSSNEIVAALVQSTSAGNYSMLRFLDGANTVDASAAGIGSVGTSLALYSNGGERMRIDSSGNVGIGTSSPADKLEVAGAIRVSGSGSASADNAQFYNASGFGPTINGYNFAIRTGAGTTSERMRIDSSGNLLVGFTSNPNGNAKFAVQGGSSPVWSQGSGQGYVQGAITSASGTDNSPSARGQGLYMWNQGTTATWFSGTVYGDADTWYVTRQAGAAFNDSAAQSTYMKMKLTSSGVAYQGNNSSAWTTTSDIRLKENIRGISNALEKITSLNPCHFEYKFALGKTKTGFIAQEFEQVFPGHVHTDKAAPNLEEYVGEGGDVKSIDADLIPYLVKAIQEQQAIIEQLRTDVAALKAKA